MCEEFINDIVVLLDNKIPYEQIGIVKNVISVLLANYKIEKTPTDIVKYVGVVPECYKTYMVSQKINGLSDKTLQLYHLVLTDFFQATNKQIDEITTNDIRIYLFKTQNNRNISNRTLNNRRSIINSFFEWCANEDYIGKNPCRNIKAIKYSVKEREPLSAIEMEKVRQACSTKRERAIVEFLYSTGCRVSELIGVKISDISFDKMELTVFGKGGKYRTVYLNAKSILYIQDYLSSRGFESNMLFVSDRKPHNRLTKAGVEKIIKNIGIRAKLDNSLFPHKIRHTTATDCIQRGMPVEDVQKMLGHSNINTTMIYAKLDSNIVKAEHKRCIV